MQLKLLFPETATNDEAKLEFFVNDFWKMLQCLIFNSVF